MTTESSEFKKVVTKPDHTNIIHDGALLWKRSEETKNKLHDILRK